MCHTKTTIGIVHTEGDARMWLLPVRTCSVARLGANAERFAIFDGFERTATLFKHTVCVGFAGTTDESVIRLVK